MPQALVLLRHAKSAWPIGTGDSVRPLASRGRRDAPIAGRWLADHRVDPDYVAVSPAQRTMQTWELVNAEMGVKADRVHVDDRVYGASWWDLLDVMRSIEDSAGTVSTLMLVGHNPGLEDLADELVGSGDPTVIRRMRTKFPTSAIAVLTSDRPWKKWGSDVANLEHFAVPRG